jgi:all-trans-retinol 13,14-reductase
VESLTNNNDLRTVLCYSWGDYGTPPESSHFLMQATLSNHFMKQGAFYPEGGSSEIAHSIIPVVERSGGKVLVRANVSRIMVKAGKAVGVEVIN